MRIRNQAIATYDSCRARAMPSDSAGATQVSERACFCGFTLPCVAACARACLLHRTQTPRINAHPLGSPLPVHAGTVRLCACWLLCTDWRPRQQPSGCQVSTFWSCLCEWSCGRASVFLLAARLFSNTLLLA